MRQVAGRAGRRAEEGEGMGGGEIGGGGREGERER